MAFSRNGPDDIGIVHDIVGQNKEGPFCVMFAEDVEQMINRRVVAKIIERKEDDRLVRVNEARQIAIPFFFDRKAKHVIVFDGFVANIAVVNKIVK